VLLDRGMSNRKRSSQIAHQRLTSVSCTVQGTVKEELVRVCKAGNVQQVREFLERNQGKFDINCIEHHMTALQHTACYGHAQIACLLLDHRASVNAIDKADASPLHWAASAGHELMALTLIEYDADLNARDAIRNGTPLQWAALAKQENVAKILIDQGADITARTAKLNGLQHAAAGCGLRDVALSLIERRVDINAQNMYQNTALHAAAMYGHRDIVLDMIDRGASVTLLNV
jgi:ankyrin repeat protein